MTERLPSPASESGPISLTAAQRLMWVGQQIDPDVPLYNMTTAFTVEGPLDGARFERAFQAVVDRSDALRTVVEAREGGAYARVLDALPAPVESVDLSGAPDPEAAARAWAAERSTRRIDLAVRPFDCALLRLEAVRWVWVLTLHHLVTDAWSMALVYRTVADAYGRAGSGTLAEAPALPPFRDYVEHERVARAGGRSAPPPPGSDAGPLYGRTAASPGTRTARVTRDLGAERSDRLRALAADPSVRAITPHLTLFSLFATLLAAYVRRVGGGRRIVLGAPSHNRPTAAFKETPGLFIEVLPLGVRVEEAETFRSLLGKVQAGSLDLLRRARPGASTAEGNRAYRVLLNYVTATYGPFDGMPATSEWVHPGHGDADHHLRLQVHDLDATGRFVLHADLNVTLFDAETRERAADHIVALLDAMLADVDQPLDAADVVVEAERVRLVDGFGHGETAYEQPATLLHAVDAQAARTPDAVAVEHDGRGISYRELGARAAALAHDLRGRGVRAGDRVAVALPRGLEATVAFLGAMRAGAAYVPLDPAHPVARLRALLAEAAPRVVLTDAASAGRLPAGEARVVEVDASGPVPSVPAALPPPAPGDVAYVLYTSGSTGTPKGVVVEHGALANYVAWAAAYYGAGRPLDAALFTPLTFDLTVTSLYVPLVSGGRVRVYAEAERPGGAVLRVVEDDAVDLVKLTPSHLGLLRGRGPTSRIKRVVLGGEELKTSQARLALDVFGADAAVWNEYGPTEATVGCAVHRFDADADRDASVPVGRPAAGASLLLLTEAGGLVPEGVPGEICVGGGGLARGYLNRPDETAARFVDRLGGRVYRTGDLGRWRPDGRLEYLGREDEQVKVGGVRVELAEVEAALAEHPAVTAAVAATVADRPASAAPEAFCAVCGLPSTYPGATFDAEGVCHLCRAFPTYERRARAYFRSMDDLRALVVEARAGSESGYDALLLLSGGKDSTYALARLVEMGLRVLAFTLDNGFISEEAKANVRRVTGALGVDHVFGSTPAMNAIFVDSLERYSNVCQGCFKTIYTLGLQEARRRGIRLVVTGLSRGQFFETRLTEELFTRDDVDVDRIDEMVLEARKAYHRVDDAVRRHLDVEALQRDETFDEVRFVDFYRYCDASLEEMLAYLDRSLPWVRPSDTGRSTNCLINEAGIWVHKRERGYHNYAFPYSWDVRVGHKTRAETLEELGDEIDEARVRRMLHEIGYAGPALDDAPPARRLVGYYVSDAEVPASELRAAVADRLPASHVPSAFVRLDAVPTTPNGKVDRGALPPPEARRLVDGAPVAPRTEAERALAAIWRDVLHVSEVGTADNFFDLGGDSILAIQIAARAGEVGLAIPPGLLFQHQTVAELAAAAGAVAGPPAEQGLVTGTAPLVPVQRWFAAQSHLAPYDQAWSLGTAEPLDPGALQTALDAVIRHHDALRLRLDGDRQRFAPPETVPLVSLDLAALAPADQSRALASAEAEAHAGGNPGTGPLVRAVHARLRDRDRLTLVIHHLGVDGVSWPILLGDLETAYGQAARGEAPHLPAKTASFRRWANGLADRARTPEVRALAPRWAAEMAAATGRLRAPEAGTEADAQTHTVTLSPDDTERVVRAALGGHGARVPEVLLAALAQALRPLADGGALRVDVEGHGRDALSLDVSRTVGWFTAVAPVALPLGAGTPAEAVQEVQGRLRDRPDPATYGLLVPAPAGPPPAVLFNYLGHLDLTQGSTWRPIGPLTLTRHPRLARPYPIEVNAWVADGRLVATWTGPGADLAAAASAFADALRVLASGPEAAAPEADAFPLAGLDAGGLRRLADLLRDADA